MDVFQTRLSQSISDEILKRIAELQHRLAFTPAGDYPSYMERVGYIKGMTACVGLIKTIEAELSSPEKGQQAAVNKVRQTYEN